MQKTDRRASDPGFAFREDSREGTIESPSRVTVLKKDAGSVYPKTMINPVITLTTISPAVRYPMKI
jgi:hypothetical protein